MSIGYINPKQATHVRIADNGNGWIIDAVDGNGNYTEACWDSIPLGSEWQAIPDEASARSLVDQFAKENVPHLVGREPLNWEEREND